MKKCFVLAKVLSFLLMAFTLNVSANDHKQDSPKRNILVILCDQLRPDFLNIYGFDAMETPGVNTLAEMGVVFDNATTASPVCAPSRASMMTGRYPSAHGVWSNDLPFNDGLDYLADRMNENGYITAAFGKMHHYPALDAKGFQVFIPMEESRLKEKEPYIAFLKERYPDEDIKSFKHFSKGLEFVKPMEEYYDYWNGTNVLNFLDDYEGGKYDEKPFLIWMSLQGPHSPYDPPKEMHGKVDASNIPDPLPNKLDERPSVVEMRSITSSITTRSKKAEDDIRLAYAEKLKLDDEQIIRVLNKLKESGMLENTSIIFSADHGDELGDFGLDQKGPFPYSHHLNIPMIIANHPGVERGGRSDILVSNLDIPGTCLDMAGVERKLGLSRSMIDMLKPGSDLVRDVNFSEFCDSYKMVEDKRYRYSYFPFEQTAMLFDKINDPKFETNLAGNPEYAALELKFMKSLMDFQIVNKGIQIETQDFTRVIQKGASAIHPDWLNDGFIINFPLQYGKWKYLKDNAYDYEFNDIFIGRKVNRDYGYFWGDPRYKQAKQ